MGPAVQFNAHMRIKRIPGFCFFIVDNLRYVFVFRRIVDEIRRITQHRIDDEKIRAPTCSLSDSIDFFK
jgi:hypothetical protein